MGRAHMVAVAALAMLAANGLSPTGRTASAEPQAQPMPGPGKGTPAGPQRTGTADAVRRAYLSGAHAVGRYRRPGPGWTHAQVQRMARKRRNQLKNRRAHRG